MNLALRTPSRYIQVSAIFYNKKLHSIPLSSILDKCYLFFYDKFQQFFFNSTQELDHEGECLRTLW
jgi:hypothetical protein